MILVSLGDYMGVFQYLTAVVGVYGVEDALKGAVDKSR